MSSSKYRQAMLWALSFPVALFIGLPFTVFLASGPWDFGRFAEGFGALAALLTPLYLTGFLLAPWAGRSIPATKGPAFLMAAAAALSTAIAAGILASLSGNLPLFFSTAAIVAFFALPASPLGALLFIGSCERLHAAAFSKNGQA